MTLALLCQFTAQHVSDVNTSIFRSLRLLGALLCRLYCAVMIEVYVLIYLSSGKCYIMCRVLLWVSVFLQACGVLWFLNIFVCDMFWCFMHLYWHQYRPSSHKLLKMDVLASETCWEVKTNKTNSVALVRMRTIPTERPLPVGEVSASKCHQVGLPLFKYPGP